MRALGPLVAVAAIVSAAAAARADDCCIKQVRVATPGAPPPHELLEGIAVGAAYRHAFADDFGAAALELELGAHLARAAIALRLDLAAGATRARLPFQSYVIGPGFLFDVRDRLHLGFGAVAGLVVAERVSATATTDAYVYAWTVGLYAEASWDLHRTRDGAVWLVAARAGVDYIEPADWGFVEGLSPSLNTFVGYRW